MPLSPTESRVVTMLSQGLRHEEIRLRLGVSKNSITSALARAREKAGAATNEHLIALLHRTGLLHSEHRPAFDRSANRRSEEEMTVRQKQSQYMAMAGKYIRMERLATAEEQDCGLPALIGLETTVNEVEFHDDGGVRFRGDDGSSDFTIPIDEADEWAFTVWPDEDARRAPIEREDAVDAIARIVHGYDHLAYDTVAYCTFCRAAAEQALAIVEGSES